MFKRASRSLKKHVTVNHLSLVSCLYLTPVKFDAIRLSSPTTRIIFFSAGRRHFFRYLYLFVECFSHFFSCIGRCVVLLALQSSFCSSSLRNAHHLHLSFRGTTGIGYASNGDMKNASNLRGGGGPVSSVKHHQQQPGGDRGSLEQQANNHGQPFVLRGV